MVDSRSAFADPAWSRRPGSTWVPTPSSVKISSRTACGSRPSTTVARGHAAAAPRAGRPPSSAPCRWPGVGISSASASGLISLDHVVAVRPVAVEALDVGEHEQLLGAQRDGQRGGGGVGVDVVDLAVLVGGDAGDHRDPAGLDQVEHGLGPDLGDLADQAEVDLLAVDDGVGGLGGEQAGVLAGQADGERAVLVDQARPARAGPGRRAPSGRRPSPRAWSPAGRRGTPTRCPAGRASRRSAGRRRARRPA